MSKSPFSRRDFLKLGGLGLGAMALRPMRRPWLDLAYQTDFPQAERLGRVAEEMDKFVNLRVSPSSEAAEAGQLAGDTVVEWLREVVGYTPYRNQRWVETPQGYIWAPLVQPVKNVPNVPLSSLPDTGGGSGLWVRVTIPYVEAQLENINPLGFRVSYLVENSMPIRFYYGQVLWADGVRTADNKVEYHIRELHGSRGDQFWASAEAFKPIYPE